MQSCHLPDFEPVLFSLSQGHDIGLPKVHRLGAECFNTQPRI